MDAIRKLEARIEEWLAPLPHLPTEWRKWLAENVWWMALVGVILAVVGAFAAIGAILTALAVFGPAVNIYGVYGVGVYQPFGGWFMFVQIVTLIFLVIDIVVMSLAIKPLRLKLRQGWELLLLSLVISAASSLVTTILAVGTLNFIPGLIGAAAGIAIGGYLLFEIRHYFVEAKKDKNH